MLKSGVKNMSDLNPWIIILLGCRGLKNEDERLEASAVSSMWMNCCSSTFARVYRKKRTSGSGQVLACVALSTSDCSTFAGDVAIAVVTRTNENKRIKNELPPQLIIIRFSIRLNARRWKGHVLETSLDKPSLDMSTTSRDEIYFIRCACLTFFCFIRR